MTIVGLWPGSSQPLPVDITGLVHRHANVLEEKELQASERGCERWSLWGADRSNLELEVSGASIVDFDCGQALTFHDEPTEREKPSTAVGVGAVSDALALCDTRLSQANRRINDVDAEFERRDPG